MASRPHQRIALLALHPRYTEAILCGDKQVEFRRVRFSREPTHVVMYATAPVGRVVGWFDVLGLDNDKPSRLWRRYRRVAGIRRADFNVYFSGANMGVAIQVGVVIALSRPMNLSRLGLQRPPQSFAYLAEDRFQIILQRARAA